MRAIIIGMLVTSASLLGATPVAAQYLVDTAGEVVRNAYGECWHTGSWTPEDAIVGCDGKVAVAPVRKEVAMPEPEPPAPEPRTLAPVVLDVDTHFAFDSARLRPEATSVLDALVERVKSYDSVEAIAITGHADRIGTEAYNQALSKRRAESVRGYLIEGKALEAGRISVEGKGESEPVKACEGIRGQRLIDCLAPNRRVEVEITCMKCAQR